MSACKVVATSRPSVWRDEEDGAWVCQQFVRCASCNAHWCKELAENATWPEAMEASRNSLPFSPQTVEPAGGSGSA